MKKTICVFGIILSVLLVAFFLMYYLLTAPQYEGEFSVNDFSEYIETDSFQMDNHYGQIGDVRSAAVAGRTAIFERFQHSKGGVFEWMGCGVQYDKANDAYYVRTFHINRSVMGGAYNVILRTDGTVLAIWGEE